MIIIAVRKNKGIDEKGGRDAKGAGKDIKKDYLCSQRNRPKP